MRRPFQGTPQGFLNPARRCQQPPSTASSAQPHAPAPPDPREHSPHAAPDAAASHDARERGEQRASDGQAADAAGAAAAGHARRGRARAAAVAPLPPLEEEGLASPHGPLHERHKWHHEEDQRDDWRLDEREPERGRGHDWLGPPQEGRSGGEGLWAGWPGSVAEGSHSHGRGAAATVGDLASALAGLDAPPASPRSRERAQRGEQGRAGRDSAQWDARGGWGGASDRARALAWLAAAPAGSPRRAEAPRAGGCFSWEEPGLYDAREASSGRHRRRSPERRRSDGGARVDAPADRAARTHGESERDELAYATAAPAWRSTERYPPARAAPAGGPPELDARRSPRRRTSAGPDSARGADGGGWRELAGSGRRAREQRDPWQLRPIEPDERGAEADDGGSSSGSEAGDPLLRPPAPAWPGAEAGRGGGGRRQGGALDALLAEMRSGSAAPRGEHRNPNPDPSMPSPRRRAAEGAPVVDRGPWDSAWDRARAAPPAAPKPERGGGAAGPRRRAAPAGGRGHPSDLSDDEHGGGGPAARLVAELRRAELRRGAPGRAERGHEAALWQDGAGSRARAEPAGRSWGPRGSGLDGKLLRDISPLRAFRAARGGDAEAQRPFGVREERAAGDGRGGARAAYGYHGARGAEPAAGYHGVPEDLGAWRGVSPLSGLRMGEQAHYG